MLSTVAYGLLAATCALASPVPQGPNTIAQYNPTVRTMSANGTWAVIPMDRNVVASLVAPKKLVPIPADKSRFPNGWPANTHPVMVLHMYNVYIEQLGLEIPNSLMEGAIVVPNVDQLGDGKTPFRAYVSNFIGGANGQALPPLVPQIVGTAEGTTLLQGEFYPSNSAISDIGAGQYTFQLDNLIIPNPVSGPSLAPNVFSYTYSKVASSKLLTAKGFHSFISQTQILNNGLCQNNPYYFNETFARPYFAEGKTTLFPYPGGLNGVPEAIAGTYTNASFYSGNSETVGFNPQDCATAAKSVDPAAIN